MEPQAKSPRGGTQRKFKRRKTEARKSPKGAREPKPSFKFEDYDVPAELVKGLVELGITSPTDIQRESIPILLRGKNLIGQARTGSGKTLAFVVPILARMEFKKQLEAMVLVPTRELCKQVAGVFRDAGKYLGVKVVEVYGGVSIQNQIDKIKAGANVVVATPGRLIDLFKRGALKFGSLKYVVLDEADRMLDMGFFPDIEYILKNARSKEVQLMFFSATILEEIKRLATQFMSSEPVEVDVSRDKLTVESTKQYYHMVDYYPKKFDVLVSLLLSERPEHALVFTNTKRHSQILEERLRKEKRLLGNNGKPLYRVYCLHGDMSQAAREKVIRDFKEHKINLVIATDVASRGLDIPDVSHVINYDVPKYEEDYVHRIGRTSRMSKVGVAVTLCAHDEFVYLCRIESFIGMEIPKRPAPGRHGRPQVNRRGEQSGQKRHPFF
ncbi:MAG: hypothetical protein Kow0069_06730 [Promethearchaeota archaeon]